MLPFRGVIYGRLKVFVVEDFSSPLTNSCFKGYKSNHSKLSTYRAVLLNP